jgi:hypothetical protein
VQVTVVSKADKFNDGQNRSNQIHAALRSASIADYIWIRDQSSAPTYLGKDNNDRWRWSMNVIAEIEE